LLKILQIHILQLFECSWLLKVLIIGNTSFLIFLHHFLMIYNTHLAWLANFNIIDILNLLSACFLLNLILYLKDLRSNKGMLFLFLFLYQILQIFIQKWIRVGHLNLNAAWFCCGFMWLLNFKNFFTCDLAINLLIQKRGKTNIREIIIVQIHSNQRINN